MSYSGTERARCGNALQAVRDRAARSSRAVTSLHHRLATGRASTNRALSAELLATVISTRLDQKPSMDGT